MKPMEQYEHIYEQFSDKWRDDVSDRIGEHVDNYLLMFGEPKTYREFRHMGQVMADSLTLWAVTEGYLTIPEKYVATEDEVTARDSRRKAKADAEAMRRASRIPQGGQYL